MSGLIFTLDAYGFKASKRFLWVCEREYHRPSASLVEFPDENPILQGQSLRRDTSNDFGACLNHLSATPSNNPKNVETTEFGFG